MPRMNGGGGIASKLRSGSHWLADVAGLDRYIERHLIRRMEWIGNASQSSQVMLRMLYRDRAARGEAVPSFDDVEFKAYSQNGEDGILLYLFSLLGTPTKKCVEMCAGNGIACNTSNLIINHGWRGLLVDGDPSNIAEGNAFYRFNRNTRWYPPEMVQTWVTAENVNEVTASRGFDGEIDLLSLDLDGMDYWIWRSLEVTRPRVVVAEYNWTWGPRESMTVPYDPTFTLTPRVLRTSEEQGMYFGASLEALTRLARVKGYRLVGTQRLGFNAFFVQDGLGEELFPAVSPEACFDTPVMRMRGSPALLDTLRQWAWEPV
jgi:hypothetical protein